MVKPAALASETESGFVYFGVLKPEMSFLTGCLHSGQASSAGLLIGRRKSKPLRQAGHPFSGSSAM
jgi:hypothetical protein